MKYSVLDLCLWKETYLVRCIDSIKQPQKGDGDSYSWAIYYCNQRLGKVYKTVHKFPTEMEVEKSLNIPKQHH